MAARTRVPILLLTGFLGSGKTSLLARWLKAPEFSGAMAIVNELGEVGIDDRLVESSIDTPVLLENGCACCAAGEDLTATLERLFWDRLHRKIPKFSWVLIETTGVADPAPILQRLAQHALVAERYHVAGTVTTFDARRGAAQLDRHPECVSQLQLADAVIVTKTDVASGDEIAAAREAITRLRPHAPIEFSASASLSAARLLSMLSTAENGEKARADAATAAHSAAVTSAFAPLPQIIETRALENALEQCLLRYGGALLRLKGIVRLAPAGAFSAVQATPDGGIEFSALAPRAGDDISAGLTIIAQHLTARTIANALMNQLSDSSRPTQLSA